MAPIYLRELLHVYTPKRLLRSSFKAVRLETVNFKTKTYGYRSYSVHAPYLWNSLPENIIDLYIVCQSLNLSSKLACSNLLLICISILYFSILYFIF